MFIVGDFLDKCRQLVIAGNIITSFHIPSLYLSDHLSVLPSIWEPPAGEGEYDVIVIISVLIE